MADGEIAALPASPGIRAYLESCGDLLLRHAVLLAPRAEVEGQKATAHGPFASPTPTSWPVKVL